MKNHRAATTAIIVVLALIVMTAAGVAAVLPHGNRAAGGVLFDGIALGGMTKAEIISALENSGYYDGVQLTLTGSIEDEFVSGEDIGLAVDSEATAEKAIAICRYAGFFENIKEAVKLKFSPIDFAPVAKVDREKLGEIIINRGIRKNGEMKYAETELLSETELLVKPVVAGQDANVQEEIDYVLSMIESGEYKIELELPMETPEPFTAATFAEYIAREPVNAEYKVEEKKIYIIDGIPGIKLTDEEAGAKVAELNSGKEIIVMVESTIPEITADTINGELFGGELSSYSSSYATSTANRAYNVALAAKSINGTILLPGEVFSYNAAIGNPSLANGYKMAIVYADGKQTEGVGGGVCQVSSTLYSAALYADLKIVERRSHSMTVSYVPKGQDATVVYGGQDFKFENNTEAPIKIEAIAERGKCTIRILGATEDANKKVEIINTVNSKTSPTVEETLDKTLPAGTRKVTTAGKTGYHVSSVRVVYVNGEEVRREKLKSSWYRMTPTEVTVGPALTSPTPSEEPTVPAVSPTEEPARTPTAEPSAEPTTAPSSEPTEQPTMTPVPTPEQTPEPTPEAPSDTPDAQDIEE